MRCAATRSAVTRRSSDRLPQTTRALYGCARWPAAAGSCRCSRASSCREFARWLHRRRGELVTNIQMWWLSLGLFAVVVVVVAVLLGLIIATAGRSIGRRDEGGCDRFR